MSKQAYQSMRDVIFRTDASLTIGTGHVIRCLTLADKLSMQGVAITFICREHHGNLCEQIIRRGFSVIRLPTHRQEPPVEKSPTHTAWNGTSWQEDAEQTIAAINSMNERPDCLIVDHYSLDWRWESAVRTTVNRIMVIDDLADRVHECDLLLDQNLVEQMRTRYAEKVPAECVALLGPKFALLQPVYAELHDHTPPRKGAIKRILIFFGGVDANDLTGRALSAFIGLKRPDIKVDVVITSHNPYTEKIRRQVSEHDNIYLHSDLPTLAPLMAAADLAIGAGGSTSWERLCLGLPSLVVTLADNQRAIADKLNQLGLIYLLGHWDTVDENILTQALNGLLQNELDEEWSLRCLEEVDGRGGDRVCTVLTISANTPLQIRSASLQDEDILLIWANDPETRNNAFHQEMIDVETHRIWFRNRLCDLDGCRFYIAETTDGIALGQVRFERQEHGWEIHYALAPMFRRRGLGRSMLESAISKFRDDIPGVLVFGQVKKKNLPSQKIFDALDFVRNEKNNLMYERRL